MLRKIVLASAALALAAAASTIGAATAADDGKYTEDGKYFTRDDVPTYNIKEDKTVDWYTYSGFRRYHSECHVCHGPDGLGSSYAPGLKEPMKDMSYEDFQEVVVNGRERVTASETSKMPAFGTNVNVMCYLDDIFVYLKARADDAVPRGRPRKRDKKPPQATKFEDSCHGES